MFPNIWADRLSCVGMAYNHQPVNQYQQLLSTAALLTTIRFTINHYSVLCSMPLINQCQLLHITFTTLWVNELPIKQLSWAMSKERLLPQLGTAGVRTSGELSLLARRGIHTTKRHPSLINDQWWSWWWHWAPASLINTWMIVPWPTTSCIQLPWSLGQWHWLNRPRPWQLAFWITYEHSRQVLGRGRQAGVYVVRVKRFKADGWRFARKAGRHDASGWTFLHVVDQQHLITWFNLMFNIVDQLWEWSFVLPRFRGELVCWFIALQMVNHKGDPPECHPNISQ